MFKKSFLTSAVVLVIVSFITVSWAVELLPVKLPPPNLNGRVPDEGMIVEAALAYAAGKPLVLFKDDARAPFGGYDNSMLTSLVRGKIVKKLKELPSALKQEMSHKKDLMPLVGDLKKAISYGKRISSAMEHLPKSIEKKRWSEEVISQVIDEALKEE